MTVQGYEVPDGALAKLEAWMHGARGFTAASLEAEAIRAGVPDGAVSMRLADRLIQKHSKAGNIEKRSQQGARVRWGWKT
jgi:hypothetical protein